MIGSLEPSIVDWCRLRKLQFGFDQRVLGCRSLVLMEMCLGFAWQLASCGLVLIEVCLGFI